MGILLGYGLGELGAIAATPLIYKSIIDIVSNPGSDAFQKLDNLVILLVAVIVFHNIVFRIADYLMVTTQSKLLKRLTDYALERLQHHSYTFFNNSFTGGLIAKSRRFVNAFETLHDQFIFQIWMGGITLASSIVVLFYYSRTLGFIFIIWLVSYIFLVRFMVKWQIPKSLKNAEEDSKVTAHYSDIISNILTVKIFGTGNREQKEFGIFTDKQEKARQSAWIQENFFNGMYQAISIGVFNIVLVWVAILLWKNGIISAGTIVLVQVYVITTFSVVWTISKNTIKISTALTDAKEMVEIIDKGLDVEDPSQPEAIKMDKGHIEFKNVHFTYENSRQIFKELSLDIKPGERVALVGHSGAGKSTIVKLLLRFINIQSGKITIDGQDITHITQDDLRRAIAYVPQEPLLFHRTIKQNIAYAKPDASINEIDEVSKRSRTSEFISLLPKGYDTLVGERGVKLSGGERQRVAIARAMLKNSPVLVLDEATSSLDSISESHIQAAFEELMAGRTTIVIAHRLSTIQKMDRIIVFENGAIAEEGSHKALLKKNGVYAKLWQSQIGGFIN